MCQLLAAIPRDGDNNSELWTTVDKVIFFEPSFDFSLSIDFPLFIQDKTNMRSKAVMKLIVGFSIYLILMAKNFFFEGKTETRYVDLLIVCNVLCSSFPVDLRGMMRRGNGELDAFEAAEVFSQLSLNLHSQLHSQLLIDFKKIQEVTDRNVLRRGIISTAVNQKDKKKGDKPTDMDQKLWAPLHYFCYWTAGISVGMMNKMGSWNMLVDYGFRGVSDYLYHYEISTLQCIISEIDLSNASRYYESYMCRYLV